MQADGRTRDWLVFGLAAGLGFLFKQSALFLPVCLGIYFALEPAARRHLRQPGPWLALVHRDPCPDNVLFTEDGEAHLIDFEFSVSGHALLDAGYWHMGFPTCWCAGTVPDAVGTRLDRIYRDTIAHAVPQAADDAAFQREAAMMSMVQLFGSLEWLLQGALKNDHEWGISTHRRRILHYLDTAIRKTTEADILPGIRAIAKDWRNRLRDEWQPCQPLGLYPAFAEAK